jgi:heme exporter protein CcmD
MDLSAAHSGYVFAAYGLSAVVLAVTIAVQTRRARATARRLGELEARQTPRRRATAAGETR